MTDNISRMYELAGVKPLCQIPDEYCGLKNIYADFEAEKQLELIKWILKEENSIHFYTTNDGYGVMTFSTDSGDNFESFEDCLAFALCSNWELFSEEQKAEIRRILE